MNIVDQYLSAVWAKLPWRSRKDITEELRSLLMDQIEQSYGPEPTEDDVKRAISEFGSPGTVAARYREERPVIARELSTFYYLIAAIMAGAMLIAFTTVFAVEALQQGPNGTPVFKAILMIPVNAFGGWISGIGVLTLIFIGLSRLKSFSIDLEDDWDVDTLKNVPLTEKKESRVESYVSIGFLILLIVLMNLYPEIVRVAEDLFARSGMPLGHRVNIDVFRKYIGILNIFWAAGIITQVLVLYKGSKSRYIEWIGNGLSAAEAILSGIMLTDKSLYSDSSGWIGMKVIFFIILIVNIAELAGSIFRMIRDQFVMKQ